MGLYVDRRTGGFNRETSMGSGGSLRVCECVSVCVCVCILTVQSEAIFIYAINTGPSQSISKPYRICKDDYKKKLIIS